MSSLSEEIKPESLVGKFVAYDNDHGACWAKIESVFQRADGTQWLVASHMIVRHRDHILHWKNRLLRFDSLVKDAARFCVVNLEDEKNLKEIEGAMLLQLLAGENRINAGFSLIADARRDEIDPELAKRLPKIPEKEPTLQQQLKQLLEEMSEASNDEKV